ncbi:MAG: xylulokinase [Ruminococcaceae bacterium]|nr:xylulokinase [Oscillospiraceae bacterium]
MFYIGIDLGTSGVKLLLVDEKGEIIRDATREYPLEFPNPGWSQQAPSLWLDGTSEALDELLEGIDKSQVRAIGVGGQMHGLVVLDENDNVIRPAILWNDGRTSEETAWLNSEIGLARLTELTGNIAFAGFTAPKLLWMKKNEPELFAKISKIMLPKDYLVYWLTGAHSCDMSDASGMLLFDVKGRCWSKEMLDICGVSESQMPKLYESADAVGKLTADIAARFGLSTDVVVCAGAGDNAAAAVGCGIVGDGRCNISLGTSGTVFITSDSFSVDPNNALHSFAHADGAYHQMGCILSAASCNKWWMDEIVGTKNYAAEQEGIDNLGENNVFYLPYLMGERSPHNDTDARGAFVGMSMDSTRKDMTLAVLEGVAFAIRDCVEAARAQGIKIDESMICGGGAKSPLWKKIFANVLGIRLTIPKTEQGPSYGGAILAAVAAGDFASVQDCCAKWVTISEVVEPDAELTAKYEKQYRRWHTLYPALKGFFKGE